MTPICCQRCGGLYTYTIQADGLFQCPQCGHRLDPRDIDLDGHEVWAVSPHGTLVTVIDPAVSLQAWLEAIDALATAEECPAPAYARKAAQHDADEALSDYVAARRAGIRRPTLGYTEEDVSRAANDGADLVNAALHLGSPEIDAINLAVNAALSRLEDPHISFVEVAENNYDCSVEEIGSWWGWGK